ncbi:MAG: hypothetical protein TEF_08675 [Rhizobiales bacterium NRL2]|jgi:crotonobetainyl-CoA:carnitine CoA-transferase CaiB-like acyl-CoA transferase|nr:MAG: hypothetical protein TEF_08675 [Rhizobiales bacterium NRL2]
MNAPLRGVRILELATGVAGRHAALMLADSGAEVVKVQAPEVEAGSRLGGRLTVDPEGAIGATLDRGKKSVALDLSSERGKAELAELAARADVVLEDLRPGTLETLGLSWQSLHGINSRLVLTRISSFGQSGPWRDRPGGDSVVQALSGLMELTGDPEGPPTPCGTQIFEYFSALHGVIGVTAALEARATTGLGQRVDISMLEVAASLLMHFIPEYRLTGHVRTRRGNRNPVSVPCNAYPCRDGKFIYIVAWSDPEFVKLCKAMGMPDIAADERFSRIEARKSHEATVDGIITEWTSGLDLEEVERRLLDARLAIARIASIADVCANEQLRHRGHIVDVEYPGRGRFSVAGPAIRYSDAALPRAYRVPVPGADTDAVLGAWLSRSTDAAAKHDGPDNRGHDTAEDRAALAGGPLKGVRILDLTRYVAGPHGTQILADLGGDVVKVEPPGIGDGTRLIDRLLGEPDAMFASTLNRSKRSIVLDLRKAEGLEVLSALAAKADVLVENFRPGVLEDMGFGPERLREINPQLSLVRISGFGQDGPWRDRGSYDPIAQALSGFMELTGATQGSPTLTGTIIGDYLAAVHGAIGALMALRSRRRSGARLCVDVSMLDAATTFLMDAIPEYLGSGVSQSRCGIRNRVDGRLNTFPCRDRRFLHIGVLSDSETARLFDAAGIGQPTDAGAAMFDRLVGEWAAAIDAEEAERFLVDAGLPAARVANIPDVSANEQLAAREQITQVAHPFQGHIPVGGPPIRLSKTPCRDTHRMPLLGEHSEAVLADWLGWSEAQCAALIDKGACFRGKTGPD